MVYIRALCCWCGSRFGPSVYDYVLYRSMYTNKFVKVNQNVVRPTNSIARHLDPAIGSLAQVQHPHRLTDLES